MVLEYFALFLVFFVSLVIFYGIIAIHDIPYEISVRRKHPHQDAIHVAGWISLFTLHVIWPFLWIWATLYKPGDGWGVAENKDSATANAALEAQIAELRLEMAEIRSQITSPPKNKKEKLKPANKAEKKEA